ncbi:histamine N-methyltransferase-like [Ornithorhynchus anatinus]|uniref:Histamine N-methyltransferase n=1 Tax=Ornithorhynchus anatinus TaxID=9258 RepID=F7F4Q5_ORNAN|nr:histamine N-methyltransferase-like [Ornithorhynchus anatinus]
MSGAARSLLSEPGRYMRAFRLFLTRSTEHQAMRAFIGDRLPPLLHSIGEGKEEINILSIGGGAGEIDLLIVTQVRARYPGVPINNEVVEPNAEQIVKYKERVATTAGLEGVRFTWHQETAEEYQHRTTASHQLRKWDLIHLIQMLYYVKDIPATLSFFHGLLDTNARILIILVSGSSGWAHLWKQFGASLPRDDLCKYISAADVAAALDAGGMRFQSHELPSDLDISDCFVEGSGDGELLLDFLTETCNFSKVVPPALRAGVLEALRDPACSVHRDGKVLFNNNLEALMVAP